MQNYTYFWQNYQECLKQTENPLKLAITSINTEIKPCNINIYI